MLDSTIRNEDIIQMEPVTQRVFNYPHGNSVPYKNINGDSELYEALGLYMRHLTMVAATGRKGKFLSQRKDQPVTFSITLRYHIAGPVGR